MIKVACVCALVGLTSVASFAQEPMGVFFPSEASLSPLRIEKLDMSVQIVGNQAVTTLDFTFANKLDRVLEGEFILPLQPGQSVYRLALDIDGRMREASIVDASKGRQSFEHIVREGIDPALLEATKGNRYKTTLYPIPARGTRRVTIGIEESLKSVNGSLAYHFPLDFTEIVDEFELTITADSERQPIAKIANPNIAFSSEGPFHQARLTQTELRSGHSLSIKIKGTLKPDRVSSKIEFDPRTGDYYFLATLPHVKRTRLSPKVVSIYWDKSLSALERDLSKETDLLVAFLEESDARSVEFIAFSLFPDAPLGFPNSAQGRARLRSRVKGLVYDGATRLAALDLENSKGDQILLFSDGVATLGLQRPKSAAAPVFAINSHGSGDHAYLESLARNSGGSYLDASSHNAQKLLPKLLSATPRITVPTTTIGKVADLHTGYDFTGDGRLWVAGRLLAPEAELKIIVKGAKNDLSQNLSLKASDALDYRGLIQRAWARTHFQTFDIHSPDSKKIASSFAQAHRIVTPLTSLIVLETAADYARFEIQPPDPLKKEYAKLLKEKREEDRASVEQKLEAVASEFKKKIEWYETRFPSAPPKPVSTPESSPRRPNPLDTVATPSEPAPPPVITQRLADSGSVPMESSDEEVFELSPFLVESAENDGYRATQTLAGTRLRTSLRDVGSSASVAEPYQASNVNQAAQGQSRSGAISVSSWSPDAEYYAELKKASRDERYPAYLRLRKSHASTPGFFFDVATLLFEDGQTKQAALVLSNVSEIRPGEALFLRAMGRRLVQLDSPQLAIEALEETRWLRDFEPQSFFDLGLAYDAAGQPQQALQAIYQVITMPVDDRFDSIELIAVMEINRILALGGNSLKGNFIDDRLVYPMPMDLRITLYWNTDDTDIDLWVTDPFGEKCLYSHNRTVTGGALSRDITQGYGPEAFTIRNAVTGAYLVEANYYGSSEQGVELPPILSATITRNFSRPDEESKTITVRLEAVESVVNLGSVRIGAPPQIPSPPTN